ncbi:MAG: nucleotidyltransferase domain-containing protein [Solirubrobacterales bacterium]|nr:nucleotidyltransferase domain-containing protein [Solirubrobacterales bacterium]
MSNSKEQDSDLAEAIARRGCILRGIVGSTVHGLSNPGTDDRDEMGACIEPREYVTGLRSFEHWVFRTQPEGALSGPGKLDLTIYGLRKYCRLALKGSPTVLLLLFIEGDDVLERAQLGAELQALAPAFVSARAGRACLGYVDAQRRGLVGDRHATRTRELSSEHGYDTQVRDARAAHRTPGAGTTEHRARHAPGRRTGTEPATGGASGRGAAARCRRGLLKDSPRKVLHRLHQQSVRLEDTVLASALPEEPDREAVDRFLVDAYDRAWCGELDLPGLNLS